MEAKPHILITVLCGMERTNWINPQLCTALINMNRDSRFTVETEWMIDARPIYYARNVCVSQARAQQADWNIQIDNDMMLPFNPLDILQEASQRQDIISLSAGVSLDGGKSYRLCTDYDGTQDGNFLGVSRVGAGVLMIRSTVWKKKHGPWFNWLTAEDELLNPIGQGGMGEDVFFCRLALAEGFTIWTHKRLVGHLKTVDLTGIAMAQAMQAVR